jgi:hypothetical protein
MLISEFLEYSEAAWDAVHRSDPRSPHTYAQCLWAVTPAEFLARNKKATVGFIPWSDERYEEINQICFELCEDYRK